MSRLNRQWLLTIFFQMLVASVWAQPAPKLARVGYLGLSAPTVAPNRREAFLQGLRELGYVEGRNLVIDYRWAEGKAELLPDLATELVSLKPDVIFAQAPQATMAAKKATTAIPIVFVTIGDPVAIGVVASLARPGANITGLSNLAPELSGKRLELLKESAPKLTSVAVFWNGTNQGNPKVLQDLEAAARELKLKIHPLDVRNSADFDSAFQAATKARAGGLMPLADPFISAQAKQVIDFAVKNRLPAIYPSSDFVDAGGLMSYAPNIAAQFHRAATYVDKILKGAKPADLPVEQPIKFEFIVNLKAAKQIGLTIPPNVLVRADRVIR